MRKNKTKSVAQKTTWQLRMIGAYLAIVGLALAAALIFDLIHAWQSMFPSAEASSARVVSQTETAPDVVVEKFARRLDGVLVDSAAAADAAPIGVMIENSIETRPQSGLSKGRVVYETLAEGGVTRFLVMYNPLDEVKKIGPVRSARHYYVDWSEEYGGAYAHAGGSPLGLSQISRNRVPDLNGIGNAWRYFYRDNKLAAPHNLFTNSEQLNRAVADFKFSQTAEFEPWTYDDGAPVTGAAPATSVSIDFSGRAYLTRYEYDAATKTYLRFNGNVPHLDRDTDDQLRTDNVIVQIVDRPKLLAEKGRIDLEVVGTGKVKVFRNGTVIEGTWSKSDSKGRTIFTALDGTPIALNRGTTWLAVVPADRPVTVR